MKTRLKLTSNALLTATMVAFAGVSVHADSLWAPQFRISLVADKKASAVGDIVTVVVQESNSTTKDSSTSSSRKSTVDSSISSFLYSPGASSLLTRPTKSAAGGTFPAMNMASSSDFQGGGKINNTESINTRFGVRVVDVLPNRNLIVEGLRQTSFAGDSRTVILRGTVRPNDISPDNTVLSYNLADVSITFKDSGAISSSQKKGWFGRVWDVLAPF